MGTTEVQRTLVKSPPELWAELSDQDSLARHLSELGEIRITSTVGESVVNWESSEASGSALIKQAGWGTKVTLRATVTASEPVTRQPPAPLLAAAHISPPAATSPMTVAALRGPFEPSPQPERRPEPARAPGQATTVEGPAAAVESEAEQPLAVEQPPSVLQASPVEQPWAVESPLSVEPPTSVEQPSDQRPDADARDDGQPEATRRGFFARLFGRRGAQREEPGQAASDAAPRSETNARPGDGVTDAPADTPAADAGADTADTAGEPIQPTALEALQARYAVRAPARETPPLPESTPNLSGELRRAEEIAAVDVTATPTEEQVKEILSGVLDRLGAAHHRPFSRA